MQINRLFEIVYILLNKKQVTAKELADRFEVSTRTIYRDIESLTEAGVPIYTNKGKGGGICLLDNFILNKSYLSEKEQREILSALQGVQVTPYLSHNEVLGKLSAFFGNEEDEWISVDFGSWDHREKEKFDQIKQAIIEKHYIKFDYYNTNLEKLNRKVAPYQLCFKEKTWYLKGYCTLRQQMRFFKLKRIRQLEYLDEVFEKTKPNQSFNIGDNPQRYEGEPIKLWLDATQAYRVFDEFNEEEVEKQEDGSFIARVHYPIDEWLYGYLLSFGQHIKVMEPENVVEEMKARIVSLVKKYE